MKSLNLWKRLHSNTTNTVPKSTLLNRDTIVSREEKSHNRIKIFISSIAANSFSMAIWALYPKQKNRHLSYFYKKHLIANINNQLRIQGLIQVRFHRCNCYWLPRLRYSGYKKLRNKKERKRKKKHKSRIYCLHVFHTRPFVETVNHSFRYSLKLNFY